MRATLLTAQRMADSIVKEAEQKRDQMMTQAEIDAKLKINCLKNRAAAAVGTSAERQGGAGEVLCRRPGCVR